MVRPLNMQKYCADAISNKDYLYDAKTVDYPRTALYDGLATKWSPRQPFGLRLCQSYIVF